MVILLRRFTSGVPVGRWFSRGNVGSWERDYSRPRFPFHTNCGMSRGVPRVIDWPDSSTATFRPFDTLRDRRLKVLPPIPSSLSLRCVEPVETSKRTPRSPQPSSPHPCDPSTSSGTASSGSFLPPPSSLSLRCVERVETSKRTPRPPQPSPRPGDLSTLRHAQGPQAQGPSSPPPVRVVSSRDEGRTRGVPHRARIGDAQPPPAERPSTRPPRRCAASPS